MELSTNQHFKQTVKMVRELLFWCSCAVILLFLCVIGIYTAARIAGPPPIEVPQSSIYYAADETIIGESNSGGEKRYWVNLQDISPFLINATIAIEDQRFYRHIGFDVKRIAGAIVADIKAFAKVQGASTISQQYARNLFLSPEKTWQRKLKEAFYTIRLEANYSKEEILEGYLNTIYYGHGAYGVEAASQYYFGKSAKDVTLSEAALLAAAPKGPSSFSPFNSWEKAKHRQEVILSEMVKQGFISEDAATEAKKAAITLVGNTNMQQRNIAPYFQDVVHAQLKNELGLDERTISLGGLRVYTTLNPNMQKIAEETLANTVAEESLIQAAFIAMDPKTGYVQALIGGRDYQESSYNRAIQASRQPGSTIKPILYYAALEKGFTPTSKFRSEETTFTFDDGREEYTPQNFNYKYANDDITMAQALALSDNVFAVKTHLYLGTETLVAYAKRFGIESKQEQVPSLALGTSGVQVVEMANAYSMLANGGKSVEPIFITKVVARDGEVIYEKEEQHEQVLDPDTTFVLTHMMTGIFDDSLNGYANVTGHNIISKTTRPYAGKSGSTNTDSWMIGFTPDLVSAVWTGYDKGKAITLPTEKTYAKNIWVDFMEKALKDKPIRPFKPTKNVVGVNVNPESGLLATEDCPVKRYMYFIKGTEPTEYCSAPNNTNETTPDHTEQPIEKNQEKPWYKRIFDWLSE
ncbi:PBP1A family penicillin-binding protein [Caldibacillus lycopersici]|uniref:PBP1A family penicillin-binding protein n=1 Tax=Perspicuibacillus lycopersici TaxID=1325689 RepID=A0AAE3ITU6_9BACI|nr:PBP1A family penicillin-binding protein [Perspicuibacillus lycopersici]MCU9613339.1 PBP1A family penicillin-binding protein [Perspicuibacillus lycopersici]